MRWHVASFADGDTHLAIPAGEQGGTVQIHPGKAEMLPELTGMPCNRCLLDAPTPHSSKRLPGGAQ